MTGSNRADTELGRLMHDLNCKNPSEMHSAILAERVYELKETPEGVEIMCDEIQKLLDEGMKIKEKQIREEEKRETACRLSEDGMTIEKIARFVDVDVEDVKRWLKAK